MSNGSECAFNGGPQGDPGLTKRELFAAMAMQGFCAGGERPSGVHIAIYSVQIADDLLAALASPPAHDGDVR